ncbi:GGDEF domain-containing phosphodiesterase [Hansschlegelia sp.]|uniref:putative bifunctional diguanylate cyclase/phosphodiesterase n=1 Tax=Hansschlegelia sp. TaxID=2041892 RepID=UPI002C076F91|nr:GGDEF domain-containing phosphodiesterase [Hansschlegelia sp.]HVI29454.1 GGDEF domain-containing phosphodiesterase [Hansschlegelia sp.]
MPHANWPGAGGSDDRWWRGLAARSTLALGAALAALAAVVIITGGLYVRSAAIASTERDLAAAAQRLAAAIGQDVTPARFDQLSEAAALDYAYVLGPAGEVLVGARPSSAPAPSPDLRSDAGRDGAAALTVERGFAGAAVRAALSDGAAVTVHVGRSLRDADAAMRGMIARASLAALALLALILPLAAWLIDRAAAPLRALTRAVTRPGAAEDEVRRAGGRRDEIGALARAHLSIARNLAESADALHRLTFDDPLTRLPNRGSLTSRLTAALQVGRKLALLRVEVVGLARVAAGLGQQHGDDAILGAADRLRMASAEWTRAALAPSGADSSVFLARISDSGFAMLALGADGEAAEELARRAVAAFETPMPVGDHFVTLSLAIGVAIGPDDGDEADGLLRSASAALSAARSAGPQSVRTADAGLNQLAYGRLRLEEDLRRALDNNELEVHFQPQIALKPGVVSGAEALVRWRHPIRGLVPPMEFVTLAEECGLVEQLGRFVLAEASRVCAGWTARGMALRVAVNVSTLQFRNPRFGETALEIIRAAGADPSRVELEITESAAMGDPEHAARELAPLKAAGVRIAIDDFGTGYSNLATLTQLPFDVLKIDRAFVLDALNAPAARVVVGTVIGMADNLGVDTVAEGVETEEQLDFVISHGCTYAQGYLFGRPMAADAFEAWYANRLVSELRALAERAAPDLSGSPSWAVSALMAS